MEFQNLEASSRVTLDDGRVLTRCDQCRQMYAERKPPGLPDCGKLCPVEARVLRRENDDAAAVYMMTRNQIVTAPAGEGKVYMDISIPAVEAAMRARGVKDQWKCLEAVRRCFHHFLNEGRE